MSELNDWQYRVLKPAERYLKRMQPKSRQRIFDELDKLLFDPTQVNFKKLKGRDGYRLRVGDYRVLIEVQRQERLFIITNIAPRGDVYK
jgi:mRNA interferase RelE/StbE